MLKIPAFILLTVLAVSAQQQLKPRAYEVHGNIKDPSGAVIGGLQLIRDGESYSKNVTDTNGDFTLELSNGDHIITIDSPELYPFRAFLKVTDSGPNPDNVQFVIDPSNVCCSIETGRPFPKPISIPKPVYPPAARAIRASGEVIVALDLDINGKVLAAKALNGHPLLRIAAEAAGRSAIFEATNLNNYLDRKVRLTYVFLLDDVKQRNGSVRYTNLFRIDVVAPYVNF